MHLKYNSAVEHLFAYNRQRPGNAYKAFESHQISFTQKSKMAPDLNSLGSKKLWDYSTPGSGGYNIPDIVYDVSLWIHRIPSVLTPQDPSTRKVKILTVGAGYSGILAAYQIQKYCENVEHVIYEKNSDIGGTWLENRYPGKPAVVNKCYWNVLTSSRLRLWHPKPCVYSQLRP